MKIEIRQSQKKEIHANKTIHHSNWNIDSYNNLFSIPEKVIEEIKEWFTQIICSNNSYKEKDVIEVLVPGIGAGRNELIFIDVLSKKYSDKKIKVVAVDYSEKSIANLEKVLKNNSYKDISLFSSNSDSIKSYTKDNISIHIYNMDFEEWLADNVFKSKYDFIFAFFVINFLDNWRESIIKTINLLKDEGIIVVPQDIGDLCYLDNSFKKNVDWKINSDFYDFWKNYYIIREDQGLNYKGLLTPSNMNFFYDILDQINLIFKQKTNTSKSFYWSFNDFSSNNKESVFSDIKTYNFWLSLIKQEDDAERVFDCLSINTNNSVFDKLTQEYRNNSIKGDLIFGQKLYYYKKQKSEIDISSLLKTLIYDKSFSATSLLNKKIVNRERFKLKNILLNRSLDVYNSLIFHKGKSMVSIFSKEAKYNNGKIVYQWRRKKTPIIYPRNYSNKQKKEFIVNYSLYFSISEYLKKEENSIRLFTELIYSTLPEKIGLIFVLKKDIAKEAVIPIFSNNRLKALKIHFPENNIKKLREFIVNEFQIDSFNSKTLDGDIANNYVFTERIEQIKNELTNDFNDNKLQKISEFARNLIVNNEFTDEIVNVFSSSMDISSEITSYISKRFSYIYLVFLTHFVDSNLIIYTSSNSYKSNNSEEGFFGLIVADYFERIDNANYINSYYDSFLSYTHYYSGIDATVEIKKEILIHAIKAAIAAIMSRNMSHNLGSHVLYYIKSKLIHAPNRFRKLLHELEKNVDGTYKLKVLRDWFKKGDVKIDRVEQKEIKAPFLLGLGKFIGYVQERQDFIATIASDFIPYFDSVNFKDFIYDVLLPDLKQKRHSNDSHAEYETKNLFLDYIAKTEGYNSSSIKIYFGKFNGTDLSTDDEKKDFERLKKIQIDMPGGIMGRQAFFSIMENIIRNTAKHNERINGDLHFNIKFGENNLYKDYHEVVISDNVTNYNEFSKIIGKALKEDYVNDKGELIKTNKGIKEIRISAAWLRGYNVAEIDEQDMGKNEPKLIEIVKDEQGKLGYKFYLPKTKEGVFITENKISDVTCLTLEEYRNKHNKNYDIVLYDIASYKENEIVEIKNMSIPRVCAVSFKDIKKLLDNKKNVFKEYYFKWVDNIIRANKANNYIDIVESEKKNNYVNENVDSNYLKYNNGLENVSIFGRVPIVFNTHNDNATVFGNFKVKESNLFNKVAFIEGISGHNSTARMIRDYENKDKLWAYKMIESALTKVLIIDERLFDTNGGNINKNVSNYIFKKDDFKGFTSVEEYSNLIKLKGANVEKGKIKKRIERIIKYNKDYKSKDVEYLLEELNNEKVQANYVKDVMDKKRITLYNIVKSKNKAIIYDLNTESQFEVIPVKDYKNRAKIKKRIINSEKTEIDIYDFVVIHESLLGKLYGMCNADSKSKKEEVFTSFKSIFPAKYRYIIHSGRSRPDFLPQETVFNQFSTIENALADCKYTLTELLFSSRIENKKS